MRAAPIVLLLACACSTGGEPLVGRTQTFSLVRLEIDPALVKNAGHTPVFRDGDTTFGLQSKAMGTFRTTAQAKAAIEVAVREPVVGIGGRSGFNEYLLISFLGNLDEDGRTVTTQEGSGRNAVAGTPTILHVTRLSETRIRVQAANGDLLLPYVFTFDSTPLKPPMVSVPTVR